jgi:hypothetical protein
MMQLPAVALGFKTLTLLLGGLVTSLAYRAYRKTGATGLGLLALGFGVVTLGALVAGLLDQALRVDASVALTVESALTAVGFAVIAYSLYHDD